MSSHTSAEREGALSRPPPTSEGSRHAAHLKSGVDRRLAQPRPLAPSSAPPSSAGWGSHDEWALLPSLHIPQLGYGPLLPASILSLLIGAVLLVGIGLIYADKGWSSSGKAFHFLIHGACWFTAGIIGLVMAESSTVTLDFPRRELTVRRYRALLAMCCAVGRTTVPFSSFVAVELRPACCGGAPWRAAQEVFLVADHPLEGRREVAVVAKVSADEAEEELKRWKDFLTDIALSDFIS